MSNAEASEAKVSVIIPTLNEAENITRRLEQLEAMGLRDVVVADGGSTDATRERVERYAGKLRPRFNVGPRGRAAQMNAGSALAKGDVLWFLHADVSPPRDALRLMLECLREPSVVAGCFKTWTRADDGRSAPWLHLADLRSRYTSLPYGDQALFVRRASFETVGGFPELPLMEDLDLSKRLSRLGRIATLDARVVVSGRRFLAAPLRYCLVTNTFPLLYRLGIGAERLAHWYRDVR